MEPVPQDNLASHIPAPGSRPAPGPVAARDEQDERESSRQAAVRAAQRSTSKTPPESDSTGKSARALIDTVCEAPLPREQHAELVRLMNELNQKAEAIAAREVQLAEVEAQLARRARQVEAEEQTLLTLRVEVTKRQADLVLREAQLKKEAADSKSSSRAGGGLPSQVVIRDIAVPKPAGPHQPQMTASNALFDDFAGPRERAAPAPATTEVYQKPAGDSLPPNETSVLMADHRRLRKEHDGSDWENKELFAARK